MKKEIDIQKENINQLFELIKQNPDLPIVPMVEQEVVGDDSSGRWMGSWGSSRIGEYCVGEEKIYLREKEAVEDLLSEKYGYDAFLQMDDETVKKAYEEMPWIKAIIVNIDLPF